jgi:hypothetical protein
MTEYIEFNHGNFPVRELVLPSIGRAKISTRRLNNELMTETGGYVSKLAELIDHDIFYFVEDCQIHLNKNELVLLILKEYV